MLKLDMAAQVGRLRERARALETGAHPTPVDSGGYGRNSNWATVTIVPPHVMEDDTVVQRRVLADVVYFRTVGEGGVQLDLSDAAHNRRLMWLGPSAQPSVAARFHVQSSAGLVVLMATPTGEVTVQRTPDLAAILRFGGRAFPLG